MIPHLIILAWVVCGVIAYGAALADLQRELPSVAKAMLPLDQIVAAMVAALGPIGLLAIGLITRFRHGFMFRVRL